MTSTHLLGGDGRPLWLARAEEELGTREVSGSGDNIVIIGYWREAGLPEWVKKKFFTGDEVSWCAAFANAMLERCGITGTRSPAAISFEKWGQRLPGDTMALGAIVVLDLPGGQAWQRHVGFVCGLTAKHVCVLGGNQGDAVSRAWFYRKHVTAARWPYDVPFSTAEIPSDVRADTSPSDR